MKNITFNTDTYNIPFNIVCTVSGLTKVYTSEEYINGKITRFGGLAALREKYICREAKKLAKAGKTKEEIIAILNTPKVLTTPVDAQLPAPAPVIITETEVKAEAPQPNIFADQMNPAPEASLTPEVQAEKPIAKQDKNGKYRNAKGHIVSEFNLKNFTLVEFVAAAA